MEIINEPSLDYLDKLTNEERSYQNDSPDVTVSPAIRDIGDIGVNTGINF